MQRGVPLQTLQMPVFYAFKVNEGGNPFIERGIELTCGRFWRQYVHSIVLLLLLNVLN